MKLKGKNFISKKFIIGKSSVGIYNKISDLCDNIPLLKNDKDEIVDLFDNDEVPNSKGIYNIYLKDNTEYEIHTLQIEDICVISSVYKDGNLYNIDFIEDRIVDSVSNSNTLVVFYNEAYFDENKALEEFIKNNSLSPNINDYLSIQNTKDPRYTYCEVGDIEEAIRTNDKYNDNEIDDIEDDFMTESISTQIKDKDKTIDAIKIKNDLVKGISTYIYNKAKEEINNIDEIANINDFEDVCKINITSVDTKQNNKFMGQVMDRDLLKLEITTPFQEESQKEFINDCLNDIIKQYNNTAYFEIDENDKSKCICYFYIENENKLKESMNTIKTIKLGVYHYLQDYLINKLPLELEKDIDGYNADWYDDSLIENACKNITDALFHWYQEG